MPFRKKSLKVFVDNEGGQPLERSLSSPEVLRYGERSSYISTDEEQTNEDERPTSKSSNALNRDDTPTAVRNKPVRRKSWFRRVFRFLWSRNRNRAERSETVTSQDVDTNFNTARSASCQFYVPPPVQLFKTDASRSQRGGTRSHNIADDSTPDSSVHESKETKIKSNISQQNRSLIAELKTLLNEDEPVKRPSPDSDRFPVYDNVADLRSVVSSKRGQRQLSSGSDTYNELEVLEVLYEKTWVAVSGSPGGDEKSHQNNIILDNDHQGKSSDTASSGLTKNRYKQSSRNPVKRARSSPLTKTQDTGLIDDLDSSKSPAPEAQPIKPLFSFPKPKLPVNRRPGTRRGSSRISEADVEAVISKLREIPAPNIEDTKSPPTPKKRTVFPTAPFSSLDEKDYPLPIIIETTDKNNISESEKRNETSHTIPKVHEPLLNDTILEDILNLVKEFQDDLPPVPKPKPREYSSGNNTFPKPILADPNKHKALNEVIQSFTNPANDIDEIKNVTDVPEPNRIELKQVSIKRHNSLPNIRGPQEYNYNSHSTQAISIQTFEPLSSELQNINISQQEIITRVDSESKELEESSDGPTAIEPPADACCKDQLIKHESPLKPVTSQDDIPSISRKYSVSQSQNILYSLSSYSQTVKEEAQNGKIEMLKVSLGELQNRHVTPEEEKTGREVSIQNHENKLARKPVVLPKPHFVTKPQDFTRRGGIRQKRYSYDGPLLEQSQRTNLSNLSPTETTTSNIPSYGRIILPKQRRNTFNLDQTNEENLTPTKNENRRSGSLS